MMLKTNINVVITLPHIINLIIITHLHILPHVTHIVTLIHLHLLNL